MARDPARTTETRRAELQDPPPRATSRPWEERAWRWLRTAVLGWTAFTSIFAWTSSNRALWRPSLSSVSLGEEESLPAWMLVAVAAYALAIFYVHGRRRPRAVLYAMLLVWHVGWTGLILSVAARPSIEAVFVGATWGWRVAMTVLAVPFVSATVLAFAWVALDLRRGVPPPRGWLELRRTSLAGGVALAPIVVLAFRSGSGYDLATRVATALAVAQWLALIHAVDDRDDDTRPLRTLSVPCSRPRARSRRDPTDRPRSRARPPGRR